MVPCAFAVAGPPCGLGGGEVQAGLGRGVGGVGEGEFEEALSFGGGSDRDGAGRGAFEVVHGAGGEVGDVGVVVGCGVDRVEQVLGDYGGEVVGGVRLGREVVRGGEVAGLAVASGQGGVGDLADHGLHEPVLAAFGAEPVGLHRDDLPAAQRVQHGVEGLRGGAEGEQAVAGERQAQD